MPTVPQHLVEAYRPVIEDAEVGSIVVFGDNDENGVWIKERPDYWVVYQEDYPEHRDNERMLAMCAASECPWSIG